MYGQEIILQMYLHVLKLVPWYNSTDNLEFFF
jgi:hypothetical protein